MKFFYFLRNKLFYRTVHGFINKVSSLYKIDKNELHKIWENEPLESKTLIPKAKAKAKAKKPIPKSLKTLVWDTYIGPEIGITKCMCCNHNFIRQSEFHCGHVLAEANGGKTVLENLRPICAQCNLSMNKKHLFEFKENFFPSSK